MIEDAARLPPGPVARRFYDKVFAEPMLGPLFPDRSPRHSDRLALYLSELFRDLSELFRDDRAYSRARAACPRSSHATGGGGSPTRRGTAGCS